MTVSYNRGSALLDAAINNDEHAIRACLAVDEPFHLSKDKDGNTALHWAVIHNNPNLIELLLTYQFPVGSTNKAYQIPNVLAALLGHWACVDTFTRHITVPPSPGHQVVLLCAVRSQAFHSAKALVERGVDCNAVSTETQYRPLHWAVRLGSVAMIRILLSGNAEQAALDMTQSTPLQLAYLNNSWDCVVALCSRANLPKEQYTRALLHAARANQYQAAYHLLKAGADPNGLVSDKEGYGPLHWAAVNDSPEMFALLLNAGAKLAQYDKDGLTPVHRAFMIRAQRILPWIKPLGVDENIKDNTPAQSKALEKIVHDTDTKAVNALYDKKQWPSNLMLSIAQGNIEAVSELITKIKGDELIKVLQYAISLELSDVIIAALKDHRGNGKLCDQLFNYATDNGYWQAAQAIDKEKALAVKIDKGYYQQLCWYGWSNSKVKATFMSHAESLIEKEGCDTKKFYRLLAESKTAKYRQLQFWSSEPTKTTQYFSHKAPKLDSPVIDAAV